METLWQTWKLKLPEVLKADSVILTRENWCLWQVPRFKASKTSSEWAQVFSQLLVAANELCTATFEDQHLLSPKRRREDDFLDCGGSSGSGSSPFTSDPSTDLEEISTYRAEEQTARDTEPMEWWHLNKHHFKLAQKLLCIPATSVPPERLFSSAGNTVNKKWASLSPSNVDMLLFLNKNLWQHGIHVKLLSLHFNLLCLRLKCL